MGAYRLADHLGICDVDDRAVMLDLRRDRYFLLNSDTAAAIARWRHPVEAFGETDSDFACLVEGGLLVPACSAADAGTSPRIPSLSLLDRLPPPRRGWALVPEVAAILCRTRAALKRRGLEASVSAFRRRKPAAGAGRDPLADIADFRAARRLVPLAPNCLGDSLSLARFLAARRIPADLVFGVKLHPFAAHCWLQNEEAVLNDAADIVAGFTPILAV